MERSEDYMAKHFSEVKRELEQPDGHMAGIGQQLKLSEEARDARNAGRRLEDENDETDLIGTVKKLEDLIAEQRRSNERIAREMRGMVSEMKDVLEKVEELSNGAADAQHQANQMALMGVANAQQKAGEMTIKNVEEVTARSRKVIDSMVEESKKRIERLYLFFSECYMDRILKILFFSFFRASHVVVCDYLLGSCHARYAECDFAR